jgi:hypothetical protein
MSRPDGRSRFCREWPAASFLCASFFAAPLPSSRCIDAGSRRPISSKRSIGSPRVKVQVELNKVRDNGGFLQDLVGETCE